VWRRLSSFRAELRVGTERLIVSHRMGANEFAAVTAWRLGRGSSNVGSRSGGRSALVLREIGGQILIGGVEFLPPHPRVAAFTPGEVGGEIFDVDLVSRAVGGDLL
jgi:hypothetical protein